MPVVEIHVIVANKIAKKYKEYNNYNFILGSNSPDSINLNGFAEKETRWIAHQRDYNLQVWRNNILEFYNNNKNNYDEYFLKGYLTHVLTDIIYDDYFYNDVVDQIEDEDRHNIMLQDMKAFARTSKDLEEVKEILKSDNTTYDILNIDKETMFKWKEKTINRELPTESPKYITEELIEKLTDKVIEELKLYKIIENT